MRRAFRYLGALAGLAIISACATIETPIGGLLSLDRSFPPDRSAWTAAPLDTQIVHARTLHRLLMTGNDGSVVRWSAQGASGQITLDKFAPAHGTYCGAITEQITTADGSSSVRDLICWGEGWEYIRDPAQPVLGPAFKESGRVYTVRRGGTLRAVARRTKTKLDELRFLNPGYPKRLAAGTKVLLP